jgi:hypothetical protein
MAAAEEEGFESAPDEDADGPAAAKRVPVKVTKKQARTAAKRAIGKSKQQDLNRQTAALRKTQAWQDVQSWEARQGRHLNMEAVDILAHIYDEFAPLTEDGVQVESAPHMEVLAAADAPDEQAIAASTLDQVSIKEMGYDKVDPGRQISVATDGVISTNGSAKAELHDWVFNYSPRTMAPQILNVPFETGFDFASQTVSTAGVSNRAGNTNVKSYGTVFGAIVSYFGNEVAGTVETEVPGVLVRIERYLKMLTEGSIALPGFAARVRIKMINGNGATGAEIEGMPVSQFDGMDADVCAAAVAVSWTEEVFSWVVYDAPAVVPAGGHVNYPAVPLNNALFTWNRRDMGAYFRQTGGVNTITIAATDPRILQNGVVVGGQALTIKNLSKLKAYLTTFAGVKPSMYITAAKEAAAALKTFYGLVDLPNDRGAVWTEIVKLPPDPGWPLGVPCPDNRTLRPARQRDDLPHPVFPPFPMEGLPALPAGHAQAGSPGAFDVSIDDLDPTRQQDWWAPDGSELNRITPEISMSYLEKSRSLTQAVGACLFDPPGSGHISDLRMFVFPDGTVGVTVNSEAARFYYGRASAVANWQEGQAQLAPDAPDRVYAIDQRLNRDNPRHALITDLSIDGAGLGIGTAVGGNLTLAGLGVLQSCARRQDLAHMDTTTGWFAGRSSVVEGPRPGQAVLDPAGAPIEAYVHGNNVGIVGRPHTCFAVADDELIWCTNAAGAEYFGSSRASAYRAQAVVGQPWPGVAVNHHDARVGCLVTGSEQLDRLVTHIAAENHGAIARCFETVQLAHTWEGEDENLWFGGPPILPPGVPLPGHRTERFDELPRLVFGTCTYTTEMRSLRFSPLSAALMFTGVSKVLPGRVCEPLSQMQMSQLESQQCRLINRVVSHARYLAGREPIVTCRLGFDFDRLASVFPPDVVSRTRPGVVRWRDEPLASLQCYQGPVRNSRRDDPWFSLIGFASWKVDNNATVAPYQVDPADALDSAVRALILQYGATVQLLNEQLEQAPTIFRPVEGLPFRVVTLPELNWLNSYFIPRARRQILALRPVRLVDTGPGGIPGDRLTDGALPNDGNLLVPREYNWRP